MPFINYYQARSVLSYFSCCSAPAIATSAIWLETSSTIILACALPKFCGTGSCRQHHYGEQNEVRCIAFIACSFRCGRYVAFCGFEQTSQRGQATDLSAPEGVQLASCLRNTGAALSHQLHRKLTFAENVFVALQ
ncbi:hypothetical protein [Rhizobium sp. R339]|uniref:hypothetical protein n=1 Tax=Rhizobium sp. R339 TaxID=1764273 RepID=UPI00112FE746|nr:hypothetical protein [Rhizobium sp. R339]